MKLGPRCDRSRQYVIDKQTIIYLLVREKGTVAGIVLSVLRFLVPNCAIGDEVLTMSRGPRFHPQTLKEDSASVVISFVDARTEGTLRCYEKTSRFITFSTVEVHPRGHVPLVLVGQLLAVLWVRGSARVSG